MTTFDVDLVIFDFDGTLVDASPDIANAANYTLRQFGLTELSLPVITGYIGGGAEVLMRRCLAERAEELIARALPVFQQRYGEYAFVESSLYPGADHTVAALHAAGKTLAIATQKTTALTEYILDCLHLRQYFSLVIGIDLVTRRKPDPEAVLRVLSGVSIPAGRALMVGDTTADLQAAHAAGVRSCAVTYGYGAPADLAALQPALTIASLPELLEHIAGLPERGAA